MAQGRTSYFSTDKEEAYNLNYNNLIEELAGKIQGTVDSMLVAQW